MKIKELIVYGYGKWIDRTFKIESDFHVFYGENEAGKSTLMSFIHSILFGFPTRHSSALRYEPKKGSQYGGKIIIEDPRFGEVLIERVHGKATGDVTVTLEDGTTGQEDLLNTILSGVDRELYQSLISFQLKDIENVEKLTKEQFHRYFLSAGALGSEKFLKEADRLERKASQLYKPTGRVPSINKKLQRIEEKQEKLQAAKETNHHYLEMIQSVDQIENNVLDLEAKRKQAEDSISEMKQMEMKWHEIEEMKQLERELNQESLPDLPEDGLFTLNHLNNAIEDLRKSIRLQQEKLQSFREEHQPSKEFLVYQEHKQAIESFQLALPHLQEKIREKQYLMKEKQQLEEEIMQMKMKENLELNQDIPVDWMTEEIVDWRIQAKHYEQEEQEILQKLNNLEYTLQSYEASIDEMEQQLWSNEKFKEEKKSYEKKSAQSFHKLSSGLLVFLFIISVCVSVFFDGLFFIFGLIGMIGTIGIAGLMYYKNTSSNSPDSYEALIRQEELKKQWRQLLARMDSIETEKREKEAIYQELIREKKELLNQWDRYKRSHQLPNQLALKEALEKENEYAAWAKKAQEKEKLEKQIIRITEQEEKAVSSLVFLEEFFPESEEPGRKITYFIHFLGKVKEEERQKQAYLDDTQEVEKEVRQLVKEEKKKLFEKHTLLKRAQTDSEEVFRQYYKQLGIRQDKEKRLLFLKEQFGEETIDFSSIDEMQQLLKQKQAETQQLLENEKVLLKEKVALEMQIKNLEEGGEYAILLQDFENEKNELQQMVDEWASQKLAAAMIKQTLKYAMNDRLPKTIKEAEKYFSYLTNDNYSRIVMDEENLRVMDKEGTMFNAEELSRGTAEPLYVSLRMAFVKNSQDMLSFPIIVDDGFVNFDHHRKNRMYHLLKEISETTQVLLFSFDEENLSRFTQEEHTVLQ
jgi:uncharacterized protein YhaN